jgi:hypothetical protein
MPIQASKVFGWFLLLFGLAMMGWAVYSSYQVFTGQILPPQIFVPTNQSVNTNQQTDQGFGLFGDLQKQISDLIGLQLNKRIQGLMPIDAIFQTFNLVSWSVFLGIVIFAGSQVASLGIKLIK